jgi:hypothetical protein
VSATVVLDPAHVAPGAHFTVHVAIGIEPGWYIYPLTSESAGERTRLSVHTDEHILAVDEWVAPPPTPGHDGPIYQGVVRFARRFYVSPAIEQDERTIATTIAYQVCDPLNCFPPATLSIDSILRVDLGH